VLLTVSGKTEEAAGRPPLLTALDCCIPEGLMNCSVALRQEGSGTGTWDSQPSSFILFIVDTG